VTSDHFDDDENPTTYFGLYSDKQRVQLLELLTSLGIRFEFVLAHESEETLREWTAWDESSADTCEGFHLFILSAHLEKLGTKLVELFPDRKFGAD
jgi:hypothetical protein